MRIMRVVCGAAIIFFSFASPTIAQTSSLLPIDVVKVEDMAPGAEYGTFNSFTQKVVANQYGYFISYLQDSNDATHQYTWRIAQSKDQGKTWQNVYTGRDVTRGAMLMSDSLGNVYALFSDFNSNVTYLHKFLASTNFSTSQTFNLPFIGGMGKLTGYLDEVHGKIYAFGQYGQFIATDLDGTVLINKNIVRSTAPGDNGNCDVGCMQYPLLTMSPQRDLLIAGW